MAEMTPAEKVGQLFLITFDGKDFNSEGLLADLIREQHIGGVVLSSSNDNFSGTDTAASARELIENLQQVAWQKSQPSTDPQGAGTENQELPVYIPLFVGISQKDETGRQDQFLGDLTQLPNLMAIGATWSEENALQVGRALGEELSALGFNLYLGPSLDVVDTSDLPLASNAGTETFGGSPYWVGLMARSYIAGLHSGSDGRMRDCATFPRARRGRPPTAGRGIHYPKIPRTAQTGGTFAFHGCGRRRPPLSGGWVHGLPYSLPGAAGQHPRDHQAGSFDQAALATARHGAGRSLAQERSTIGGNLGSRAVRCLTRLVTLSTQ